MNILITGSSKWIWKALVDYLDWDNTIYKLSRSEWCNLTEYWDIKKFISQIDNILDVIILNAWVWEFWKFEDISLEKSEDIININLLWNIRLLKALEKNINKKTKIIFMWSIISKKFMSGASVYQASKFWLRGFAWWLKSEWKKIYLINPKIVQTDFHKNKVLLWNKYPETKMEDILKTVTDIISGEEKRFEIDL